MLLAATIWSLKYDNFGLDIACRDRWYLARVQLLIPRIAHDGWN